MRVDTLARGVLSCATFLGATGLLAAQGPGTVVSEGKIATGAAGFLGVVADGDRFGRAVAPLGDLDGNGVTDLAVGAYMDDDGGLNTGAVWILFLHPDGTVAGESKVSQLSGGFLGRLVRNDHFGTSLATLGDLGGDGTLELAVGTEWNDDGGINRGAVWIVSLDAAGRVTAESKISQTSGGFAGTLTNNGRFGRSVASLGDLDGDGVTDLAVGVDMDDDGGADAGAVWVLFLAPDGTVRASQKISATSGGFAGALLAGDHFGSALAALGDLDGDGVSDLAVGAEYDDQVASSAGAVWVLFLNADGTVKSHTRLAVANGLSIAGNDRFGSSLAVAGDLDGDGIAELVVGAVGDDDGASQAGAAWIGSMTAAGSASAWTKISATQGGLFGPLALADRFGSSVAPLGDLNGDGDLALAVGADGCDAGGLDRGATWIVSLETAQPQPANAPPGVSCFAPGTVEMGVETVLLTATVSDPDGDMLAYDWSLRGRSLASGSVQAPVAPGVVALPELSFTTGPAGSVDLGPGEHVFTLTVDDGVNPPVSCEARVQLVDTLAPLLTLTSETHRLWPPNGRLVPVVVRAETSDAAGSAVTLSARVSATQEEHYWRQKNVSLRSFTEPCVDQETGAIEVRLRARRATRGRAQTYRIEVSAVDASGNRAVETIEVVVPGRS